MKNKKWKELKQECLEQIDFDKCFTAMTAVGWVHAGYLHGDVKVNTALVTLESIKETASYVLDFAIKNVKEDGEEGFCGTGGFEANAYKSKDGEKTLILKMVIADWEAWGYNE